MFLRALETGETERPAPVMHTLIAEVWRRAGRFDEALEECAAVETELGLFRRDPSGRQVVTEADAGTKLRLWGVPALQSPAEKAQPSQAPR